MNLTVFELIVAESKITLCELTFHWYDKLLSGIDDVKFWTESEYFSLVLAIISFPLLLIIWTVEGILVSLFSLFELHQIIIGDAIAQMENNPSVAIKIDFVLFILTLY